MSEILISPVPAAPSGESPKFAYQRRFSVKGLFNPQQTVNAFSILTFPNFEAFFKFIKAGLHVVNPAREYICIIPTAEELDQYLALIKPTNIYEQTMITLQPGSEEVLEAMLYLLDDSVYSMALSLSISEAVTLTARLKEDTSLPLHQFFLREGKGNWGWIRSHWEPSTYGEEYEAVLKAILGNPFLRYLDLQIDYEAFEDQPLKELHKLFFYFVNLKNWGVMGVPASRNPFNVPIKGIMKLEQSGNSESLGVILKNRSSCLRASVSEDLSLSVDDKGTWDFPLGKYLEDDGESIPMAELNRLRALLDLRFVLPEKSNMYFVDVASNIRIMKDPYVLPHLTKLILDWLQLTQQS